MRFAFTDQQRAFRDAVHQVLERECTTADLRAAYAAPSARSPRWDTLAEMGVVGLTVPEPSGGLGLALVDLVTLLEEAGAVALPEPLADTTAVAAPLLDQLVQARPAGTDTLLPSVAKWLEGIASGRVTAAVAESPSPDVPVAGADGADLLVLVSTDDDGPALHLVGTDRVSVTPVPSLDPTRRLGRPVWTPDRGTRVAVGPVAADLIRRTADRASVATAAGLLGLSQRMIAMAADYARARHQFGHPIGSFQAVKHLLAGAQVRLEFARPVVYAAAWADDHDRPDRSRAASVAKAYASDTATEAARVALQVHGAIGYTWECDLHLFLKRAWALSAAWGSAADHRRSVLDALVAPDGAEAQGTAKA